MDEFFCCFEKVTFNMSSILWGPITIAVIIFTGLLYSVRLKFFQLTKMHIWVKHTFGTFLGKNKNGKKSSDKNISQLQAMTTALAGAIGTGNIVGVATAITLGGPGAIFWMWVAAFFGMITIFAENILGVLYRKKGKNGEWLGGPMYYIRDGLHNKFLSIVFSVSCVFATFGIGNMTQANSIAAAIQETFKIKTCFTGIVLSILSGIIIFGGIKRIANVTEKVVPFMALFYIFGGIVILIVNAQRIPLAFSEIFSQAFSFKAVTSGTGGYVLVNAMKYGIARGVFTNEAGLGSSPIVHAAAETNEPITQGMWGIFQVFIDTFVVCSITALCILSTGVLSTNKEGISLSTAAFESLFGKFGGVFICISIVLFAFATIISWSYYGERSIEYMSGTKWIVVYRALYVVLIMYGSSLNLGIVWNLSDIFNALMCLPNLIALILLSNKVVSYVKSTNKNKKIL